VLGDGPIDLVYLPGFINNIEAVWTNPLFSGFLQRLSSFCRLVMIDRRGAGLSDRLSLEHLPPLEDLVDDVAVVMDTLGSERARHCSDRRTAARSARCSRKPIRIARRHSFCTRRRREVRGS
jgi:hypothetical protein